MITKKEFLYFMQQIKKTLDKSYKVCEFCEQFGGSIFLFENEINTQIQMLCQLMDIEYNENKYYGDDIQYFIFDLEWGKNAKKLDAPYKNEEELYDYICTSTQSTPKQRVKNELAELKNKYDKLISFLASNKCNSLTKESINLLNHQCNVMEEYIATLRIRLSNWKD